ncbi:Tubulin-specific chaperone D [Lecanosticta acicola]|uniref:Tubulin-specific chaperone D n=1 Tax=Lecanosticta acicola TaxID=111012 RepID=A0AAI8Z0V9_9PEZI|nr:Tubulin-specific chaperone D [Lecanosticta acicola]
MENSEEDDDLQLVKASATLLAELERDLPRTLWKPTKPGQAKRVHSQIRLRDLDHIISLIEPFQGEPQLLDAKLKILLPPIIDAYLASLGQQHRQISSKNTDIETGVCCILYNLCKVRGAKVIVGFLNNEPRYLEPILATLERTILAAETSQPNWRVPYLLLLWLSHLLLTPFDLSSISNRAVPFDSQHAHAPILQSLPPLTARVLRVGLHYLPSPTKAQDAAAAMLVRLVIRPDVQKLNLANTLVKQTLPVLASNSDLQTTYDVLGSLRFVAGVASSAELCHLVPEIYTSCRKAFDEDDSSSLSSNAVTKKIVVKVFRNVAILSLRSAATEGPLLSFLQTTDVLESVIDYLLRSLADKDTPVRYAAAKAISSIVLELESEMSHQVIQAILDTFKEDIPRFATTVDLATANPLKWHGLTLALAHCLFKRSASVYQLPDILDALISALQFQQRTATGSTLGTNVRDAANFGIWSLARRYTTAELLPVKANDLHASVRISANVSIIQHLATQLILTACLDPAGNIRRGASAALQELVGRHPDQVHAGIALVQIVDYQAVSLRSRAMIEVANDAATLGSVYSQAILDGLFEWRGLGAADVLSRESAATSVSRLSASQSHLSGEAVLEKLSAAVQACPMHEVEAFHGLSLTAAYLLRDTRPSSLSSAKVLPFLEMFKTVQASLKDFSPRILRAELPASLATFLAELCRISAKAVQSNALGDDSAQDLPLADFDAITERLLWRKEESITKEIPNLARSLLNVKRQTASSLGCIGTQNLSNKVAADGSKSTLHGVGRAIALGALISSYEEQDLSSEEVKGPISSLTGLMNAMNVDWRIVGAKALQLVVEGSSASDTVDAESAGAICEAIHCGLNDYTIDERGDVGSLVRLKSITCAWKIFEAQCFQHHDAKLSELKADIYRLSLEKLDRVRLLAALCRRECLGLDHSVTDTAGISSSGYFRAALLPLTTNPESWIQKSLLEGCISCAGVAGETVLQVSRQILTNYLSLASLEHLHDQMTIYTAILNEQLTATPNTQPALELLAFLLDMHILQRLSGSNFKFRNLLSAVQKAHHKSNDIPKILAAVHVYIGLADVPSIRVEVLKKLFAMLKTNPYPRVRIAVAEALWAVTREEQLKACDWTKPASQNVTVLDRLKAAFFLT